MSYTKRKILVKWHKQIEIFALSTKIFDKIKQECHSTLTNGISQYILQHRELILKLYFVTLTV